MVLLAEMETDLNEKWISEFAKNNMTFIFRHQDNKNLKFFVTVLKNKMFVGKNDTTTTKIS